MKKSNDGMKMNIFRFYIGYLSDKNRRVYREMGHRYHTRPWVIYRLLYGSSIRSKKGLNIFHQLMGEKPLHQNGQGE